MQSKKHLGPAYRSTFWKRSEGRPTASVLVWDPGTGCNRVEVDADKVREVVREHYSRMVALHETLPNADDALPIEHLPDLNRIFQETKTIEYPTLTKYITTERWDFLISKTSKTSGPGASGISFRYIAEAPPEVREFLRSLVNRCLRTGRIPKQWHEALLFPITKDPTKGASIQNGRPICLLETPLKLLTMHLNEAIQTSIFLAQGMHPLQMGFHKKRATESALRITTAVLDTRTRRHQATHIAYLDLTSAFCSVPHKQVRQALHRFNVPPWAIDVMMHIDDHGTTRVITDHGLCDSYDEESGVRQGDVLSPTKFVLWIDALLTWLDELDTDITIKNPYTSKDIPLHAILFADDIMLISASAAGLQRKLTRIHQFLTHCGVQINENKSYYTSSEEGFDPQPTNTGEPTHGIYFHRKGKKTWIKGVGPDTAVRYLGLHLTLTGNQQTHIDILQQKLTQILGELRKSALPFPMLREMLAGKLGGTLGYSLPFIHLSKATILLWMTRIQQLGKTKLHLNQFAPPAQLTAHPAHHGLGLLHVEAHHGATMARSLLRGLNSITNTGRPTAEALSLLENLAEHRRLHGSTQCPLHTPADVLDKTPSVWNTMATALAKAELYIQDAEWQPRRYPKGPRRHFDIDLDGAVRRWLDQKHGEDLGLQRSLLKQYQGTIKPLLLKQGIFHIGHLADHTGQRLQPIQNPTQSIQWILKHLTDDEALPLELHVSKRHDTTPPPATSWATHVTPPTRRPPAIATSPLNPQQYTQYGRHRIHWYEHDSTTCTIVTDGSSTHDNTQGSYAAVMATGPAPRQTFGVALGNCSPLRAELLGILEGLWMAPLDLFLIMVLDCETALRAAPHLPDFYAKCPAASQSPPQELLQAMIHAYVDPLDPNRDILVAIYARYLERTAPTEWRWYPGHQNETAPLSRSTLNEAQVTADLLCRTAAEHFATRTRWNEHSQLDIPFPAHAEHSPLDGQQRFTLRQASGAIVTSKPKTILYNKISSKTPNHKPSNPLTTPWNPSTTCTYLERLHRGETDRECLKFQIHCSSNILFTEPHWIAYTSHTKHPYHGPPLPCHRCHLDAPSTLCHVLADCPANQDNISLATYKTAARLAKLGSSPWTALPSIISDTQTLLTENNTLTLSTKQIKTHCQTPANEFHKPKELPYADILRHGLTVKPAGQASTLFAARDAKMRIPTQTTQKTKTRLTPPEFDTVTVITIPPPQTKPTEPPHHITPHKATLLWRAYKDQTQKTSPTQTFTDALWHACDRGQQPNSYTRQDQWWTSRPLLQHTLRHSCNVQVELFSCAITMSDIPIRFSAHPRDAEFGFHIDCLRDPAGVERSWAQIAPTITNDSRTLIAYYANPEYLSQLTILLTYAQRFLDQGNTANLPLRLYAFIPLGTALSYDDIRLSNGTLLVLFANSCYDFLPYAHWHGEAHSDSRYSRGAPMQMALIMWETDSASLEHPLTPHETQALREWATFSCTKSYATSPTPSRDPSPNVSFGTPLATDDMQHHVRLKTFYYTSETAHTQQLTGPHKPTDIPPNAKLVTNSFFGPLLPGPDNNSPWETIRQHFTGAPPPDWATALPLLGLSTSETQTLQDTLMRARVRLGATMWHDHGETKVTEETDPTPDTTQRTKRARAPHKPLPTASARAAQGTLRTTLNPQEPPVTRPPQYVDPTAPTQVTCPYTTRNTYATYSAGRNPALPGISQRKASTTGRELRRNAMLARERIAHAALPQPDGTCHCGEPAYTRNGQTHCPACRRTQAHHISLQTSADTGHPPMRLTPHHHSCPHCQCCGHSEAPWTIAGLSWACNSCATHIEQSLSPAPIMTYATPLRCVHCPTPQTNATRRGLDGRPLCVTHADPNEPDYRQARATMILEDYAQTCLDTPHSVPPAEITLQHLKTLANALPRYDNQGNHFLRTAWSDILPLVHATITTYTKFTTLHLPPTLPTCSSTIVPPRSLATTPPGPFMRMYSQHAVTKTHNSPSTTTHKRKPVSRNRCEDPRKSLGAIKRAHPNTSPPPPAPPTDATATTPTPPEGEGGSPAQQAPPGSALEDNNQTTSNISRRRQMLTPPCQRRRSSNQQPTSTNPSHSSTPSTPRDP